MKKPFKTEKGLLYLKLCIFASFSAHSDFKYIYNFYNLFSEFLDSLSIFTRFFALQMSDSDDSDYSQIEHPRISSRHGFSSLKFDFYSVFRRFRSRSPPVSGQEQNLEDEGFTTECDNNPDSVYVLFHKNLRKMRKINERIKQLSF